MPTEAERIKLLTSSIERSLKLFNDYGLLKDIMGDDRYGAAVHTLQAALRRERCLSMAAGAELTMVQSVCVSQPEGGGRVVPLKTRLRFTGRFDAQQKMECEALQVPDCKSDMSSPVVEVGERVWVLPDWCRAA